MAKIKEKSNFRVIVEPKGLGDYGGIRVSDSMFHKTQQDREKAYERRCKEIIDQIKRHVDEVGRMEIDYDTEETCSHCKLTWELDENGVPVCCDKAIEEHEATQKEKV